MEKFIYNDFVSDKTENYPLMNSQTVKNAVMSLIEEQYEITDIGFVGMWYRETLLYEWRVTLSQGEKLFLIRLPFYLPKNQEKAAAYLDLYNQAYQNGQAFLYESSAYILVNYRPYYLSVDEQGDIKIKKIILWASQKMVQEYVSQITNSFCAASLVLIHLGTTSKEDSFDIGWLIYCDGQEMLLSVDAAQIQLIPGTWIKDYEPFSYPYFLLNGIKYTIAEDNEDGQFLIKEK